MKKSKFAMNQVLFVHIIKIQNPGKNTKLLSNNLFLENRALISRVVK